MHGIVRHIISWDGGYKGRLINSWLEKGLNILSNVCKTAICFVSSGLQKRRPGTFI